MINARRIIMDTKILIADDDPIVHESLKIYLEAEGL